MKPREQIVPTLLPWKASVADVIAAWPPDRALAALVSSGDSEAWSRWSLLAAPSKTITTVADTAGALTARPRQARSAHPDQPPFQTGWIGWISYEAGAAIEPAAAQAAHTQPKDREWPDVCLHRCDGAYAYDHKHRQWWIVGDESSLPPLTPDENRIADAREIRIGELDPGATQAEYAQRVDRVLAYIRAGDVFQANISRRMSGEFVGSPRAFFLELLDAMAPWFGAIIEGPRPGRIVLSVSPELYLRVHAGDGRILTRPIKGTSPAAASPSALNTSEKDQAELAMIVDLMRNDLGRVSEYGSVRVPEARAIEAHGSTIGAGVWHGVATVEGRARHDATTWDIIKATFPPGSVTGAPKIRAMQIIQELEPTPRGPYCGTVGWFDDSGACALNVAIRTAAVTGDARPEDWHSVNGVIDYHVGAGIVSDSDPNQEWRETEAKAAGFLRAIEQHRAIPSGIHP